MQILQEQYNMVGEGDYVRQLEDEEQASEAILRTVAAASDRPPLELPPLQQSVDVDDLDQLFATSSTIRSLRFEYVGYEVTIEPDCVRVCED
jgi:hypothetical protein